MTRINFKEKLETKNFVSLSLIFKDGTITKKAATNQHFELYFFSLAAS
jgi:hypothetical protein